MEFPFCQCRTRSAGGGQCRSRELSLTAPVLWLGSCAATCAQSPSMFGIPMDCTMLRQITGPSAAVKSCYSSWSNIRANRVQIRKTMTGDRLTRNFHWYYAVFSVRRFAVYLSSRIKGGFPPRCLAWSANSIDSGFWRTADPSSVLPLLRQSSQHRAHIVACSRPTPASDSASYAGQTRDGFEPAFPVKNPREWIPTPILPDATRVTLRSHARHAAEKSSAKQRTLSFMNALPGLVAAEL